MAGWASGSPRVRVVLFLLVSGTVTAFASAAGWSAEAAGRTSPEASGLVAFNMEPKGSKGASDMRDLEVWLEKSDGTDKRLLAHGADPLVSPSGRWVAVDTVRGAAIYSAAGRRQRTFAGTPLAWAPDSEHLALVQPAHSPLERLVIASVSSGKQVIVGPAGAYRQVSFSPNGQQIAYAYGHPTPGGFVDIYETGLRGGKPRRLTASGWASNPVWGPPGIAFSASGPASISHRGVIWILNPQTRVLHRLTSAPPPTPPGWANTPPSWGAVTPSAWSADGKTLLAQGSGQDTCVAYVVDSTGKETVVGKPTPGAGDTMPNAISRDGRYALISSGGDICRDGPNSSGPTNLLGVDLRTGRQLTLAVGAWSGSWNR
jgi:hypothetical protein